MVGHRVDEGPRQNGGERSRVGDRRGDAAAHQTVEAGTGTVAGEAQADLGVRQHRRARHAVAPVAGGAAGREDARIEMWAEPGGRRRRAGRQGQEHRQRGS